MKIEKVTLNELKTARKVVQSQMHVFLDRYLEGACYMREETFSLCTVLQILNIQIANLEEG